MDERELICINCPLGCVLTVNTDKEGTVSVSGNTCPRGEAYGRTEVTDPRRTVTSTVRIQGERERVLPVKTAAAIPKGKIMECVEELGTIAVKLPVTAGDVIVKDIVGTGIPVIATKSFE
ncbi:MAG: DUF1667 domain-containing protein [Lachnospiraceae bacterium]|nr:DUF1667 domain-containing protein [Lachnospiraceae bacterium]